MKETGRKTLAWLLSMLMLLGTLPGMALAAGEPATYEVASATDLEIKLGSANNGDTIRLTADITKEGEFSYSKEGTTVTLDLNGYSIRVGGDDVRVITVNSGTLVLADSATPKVEHHYNYQHGGEGRVAVVLTDAAYHALSSEEKAECGSFEGGYITGGNHTDGGGVYVATGAAFTLSGGTIFGNCANGGYGAGVYVAENGTFTMSGGGIVGNSADRYYSGGWYTSGFGGGVYVDQDGTFTMESGTIRDNLSDYGGGVYVEEKGSSFTMTGGSITGNRACSGSEESEDGTITYFSGMGGGVYVGAASSFTMSGESVVGDNFAGSAGGGVYLSSEDSDEDSTKMIPGCVFTMTGGTISGNSVYWMRKELEDGAVRYDSGMGGGVYVDSGATFNMSGESVIGDNLAGYEGGGVYVDGDWYDWYDDENEATTPGGVVTMTGGSIENNYATYDGGGVYLDSGSYDDENEKTIPGGTLTMSGGSITNNVADDDGAGVYADSYASFTMSGGSVTNNDGGSEGGGVYAYYDASFTMTGGRITGNRAHYGAGVYVYGADVKLSDAVVIARNYAWEWGIKTDEPVLGGASNLYFSGGIISALSLSGDAEIGVAAEYDSVFTAELEDAVTAEAQRAFFTSDSETYEVVVKEIKFGKEPVYVLALVSKNPVRNVFGMENGTVAADPNPVLPGETVTLTVKPESGYRLKEGSLKVMKNIAPITPGSVISGEQALKIADLVEQVPVTLQGEASVLSNFALFDFDGVGQLDGIELLAGGMYEDYDSYVSEEIIGDIEELEPEFAFDNVVYQPRRGWRTLDGRPLPGRTVETSLDDACRKWVSEVENWRCVFALASMNIYAFAPADVLAENVVYSFEEVQELLLNGLVEAKNEEDLFNAAALKHRDGIAYFQIKDGVLTRISVEEEEAEDADEALTQLRWKCTDAKPENNAYLFVPVTFDYGEIVSADQVKAVLKDRFVPALDDEEEEGEGNVPKNAAVFMDSYDFSIGYSESLPEKLTCCVYDPEGTPEYQWGTLPNVFGEVELAEFTENEVAEREWTQPEAMALMGLMESSMTSGLDQNNTYIFVDCTVETVGSGNTYTFTMPNSNVTVYAEFERAPVVYSAPDPVLTVPVTGDNTAQVSATVSGTTANVQKATEQQLDAILGASHETGEVTVDVRGLNRKIETVSIPTETLDKISDAVNEQAGGATGLTVKLSSGSVTLDVQALAAVNEQASGSNLSLSLQDVGENRLSSTQKAAAKEMDVQAVYDAYMTSGGRRISEFKGGTATVTVPYTLKNGQISRGVTVWYLAGDGSKTEMPSSFDGRNVSFIVTHFSNYAIVYDAERAAGCPQDDTCPISRFVDADTNAWYHDGLHWALENGVMSGVSPKYFAPNGDTSRAMVATMLWRMEGSPVVNYAMDFADVESGMWYTEAIRWAASTGIITGFKIPAKTTPWPMGFAPNDPVTREQLAAILYRYAQYKGADVSVGEDTNILSYEDAFSVGEWAIPAMQWACGAGIINGVNGSLVPQGNAARVQTAAMLMRYSTAK